MSVLSGIAVHHIFTDIWRTACQIDTIDLKKHGRCDKKMLFLVAPAIYLVFRSGRINCRENSFFDFRDPGGAKRHDEVLDVLNGDASGNILQVL